MTVQNNEAKHENVVPTAVRRAAEEAERLQRELIEGQKPPAPNGSAPEPAAPAPGAPPASPEAPKPEAGATPPVEPPGAPPAAPEPLKPEDPNSETYKSRFESEQGRYRKAAKDNEALANENANLRRLLATTQPPAPVAPAPVESTITPEEEAEWGPQLIGLIGKKAEEIAQRSVSKLQAEVDALKGQVKATGAMTIEDARERMKQTLNSHPEIGLATGKQSWLEINRDQKFFDWLEQIDDLSGVPRQSMLEEAWNLNNASRVAAFFTKFLQYSGAPAPQNGHTRDPAPPPPAAPKVALETLAAPGPQRSAPAPVGAADKEIIPRTDIARFYADRTAGRWKGREKEADDYEKRIFAAQAEGRIS